MQQKLKTHKKMEKLKQSHHTSHDTKLKGTWEGGHILQAHVKVQRCIYRLKMYMLR